MKSHKNRKMSPTVRHKYKYFYSTVQRAKYRRQKFHFCRLPFDLRPRNVKLNLSNIWSSPHQNTLQGNRHSFFITHHLTPPVVRIPSLTVSFSVKDASAGEQNDFENKSKEMASFFRSRGYPLNVVQRAQERVSAIPRDAIISERSGVTCAQPTIPLVLTYHPTNAVVKNIMTRNFHLLRDDPDTEDIYRP